MVNKYKTPRVIAITGGKGGVGKTSIAINLAIALSRSGSKVCLFDGDTALANTNIMLGLYPAYTLEHLFTGEKSIQDIVLDGPEGIQIVPGASGFAQCVDLDVGQQQRLVTSIRAIEPHYDYMLVDTAAGISPTVLHFVAAAQVAVVVVTPEPTSLTDAFSLLKVLKRRGYRRKVQIIVNMVASSSQAKKVFQRFSQAVSKYLDLSSEYLGSVWMDESMRTAVTLQRPVALYPKTDPSARCFYRLAEQIDDLFAQSGIPRLAFSAYWQKVVERHSKGIRINSQNTAVPSVGSQQGIGALKSTSSPQHQAIESDLARHESQLVERNVPLASVVSNADKQGHDYITVSDQLSGEYRSSLIQNTEALNGIEQELQAKTQQAQNSSDTDSIIKVEPGGEQEPLSADSEDAWLDLRFRMNQFFSDDNATPEQITTLLSSCIHSYGDRLGNASVDLLHGLLHSLDPKQLTDEQKQLLLSGYEHIGLNAFRRTQQIDNKKVRYDASGFGNQQDLAQTIRSSAEDMPLESLLESIKYASLVDSSGGS
jgi:MinD-like ATPase involved in chromosome partitioning or flagellar assembly